MKSAGATLTGLGSCRPACAGPTGPLVPEGHRQQRHHGNRRGKRRPCFLLSDPLKGPWSHPLPARRQVKAAHIRTWRGVAWRGVARRGMDAADTPTELQCCRQKLPCSARQRTGPQFCRFCHSLGGQSGSVSPPGRSGLSLGPALVPRPHCHPPSQEGTRTSPAQLQVGVMPQLGHQLLLRRLLQDLPEQEVHCGYLVP